MSADTTQPSGFWARLAGADLRRGVRLLLPLALAGLLFGLLPARLAPTSAASPKQVFLPLVRRSSTCRFGIAVPYGFSATTLSPTATINFDMAGLRAGTYLDWNLNVRPARPNGIEYVQMFRLADKYFSSNLALVPAVARANPGATWLIGNEPDTTYGLQESGQQDRLFPEVYASRYYAAYNAIKAADPSAKVGIGGLVHPTAVRMEYLDRVFASYLTQYGKQPPSDFWHIHAFVLNEKTPATPEWGTGMPPDNSVRPYAAAPEAIDPSQNDSLDIFKRRLEAFRAWMAKNGQRNKPLWVTEYGVLMPSRPETYRYAIPITRTQQFMLGSFSYFNTKTDPATGYAGDQNRLVQRWYWWALSTDQAETGGGLYDLGLPGVPRTVLYDSFAAQSDCR